MIAFSYELGAAWFYGIPGQFITLSWTKVTLAILSVIVVFQMILSWGYVLAVYLKRRNTFLTPKRVLGFMPFVMLSGTLLIQHGIKGIAFIASLLLIVVILILDLVMGIIEVRTIRGFYKKARALAESTEHQDPLSVSFNKIALAVFWGVVLLAAALSTGYSAAKSQVQYLTTIGTEKKVVLRKYGNTMVLAPIDKSKKIFKPHFNFQSVSSESEIEYVYEKVGPLRRDG